MIHPLDPLLTFLEDNPDYNQADFRQECERLFQRQKAIDDLLRGQIHASDLLDLLDSHGLDAVRYADLAIGNLERAIAEEMEFDEQAIQLYLPA